MIATLCRATRRKGIVAGLAALVATAGIGVAVAAPSEESEERTALAIGVTDEIVDDAAYRVPPQVDVPQPPLVVIAPQDIEDSEDDSTPPASASANLGADAGSTPVAPSVDVTQFLPEGSGFDRDALEDLLAGGVVGDDVAEGAEDLADEVIARIQACGGDLVGQFGSGFDFGGSAEAGGSGFGAGGSAGAGQSFATSVVDDVLPCIAGLVDDAIGCVGGLVEEILSTVMGMDFDEIAGFAGVIVDELVDCVGGTQTD
ncbi:MAG: hypothetical protein H0V52_07280 [Acidimicrobiia bacterium]|nr:hypothetical protein [Acidimicrobiia bacterium]